MPRGGFSLRSILAGSISLLVVLSALPAPTAFATPEELNTSVVTADLAEAVRAATGEIKVIVLLSREFTQADADFLAAHDAKLYGRLQSMPVALLGLSADATIALSWRDGVERLELDRPLVYLMNTATLSTQAAAVWGEVGKPGVSSTGPVKVGGKVVDGSGVSIAVVDSGIDATHPDLPYGTKVIANKKHVCESPGLTAVATGRCYGDFLINDIVLDAGGQSRLPEVFVEMINTDTTSGHGTHVAGIAAGTGKVSEGRHRGAAPGATLVGFGTGETLAVYGQMEAWEYIYLHGDDPELVGDKPIRVVTNSFGEPNGATGSTSSAQFRLIQKMVQEKDIVFTFAAGNAGGDGSLDRTSSYCDYGYYLPGVICVANGNDANAGLRTEMVLAGTSSRGLSSNKATWPELTAPGSSITAPWAKSGPVAVGTSDTTPYYTTIGGTSMATPHVAGLVALMMQANPGLTPAQIEDILKDTAVKFPAGSSYVADDTNPGGTTSIDKGAGLADALAAVNAALAASHAGSGLHGITGSLNVYQEGLVNPFVVTRPYTTVAEGTTPQLSLRFARAAAWSPYTLTTTSPGEFRLVTETGAVLETIPAAVTIGPTETEFFADYTFNVAPGVYTLQAWVHGQLVDFHDIRIVRDEASDCVLSAVTLGFGLLDVAVTGLVSAPNPVDAVRVDVVRDGVPVAWGLHSRQTADGLESFSVSLPTGVIEAGDVLELNVVAQDVPCVARVIVPDVTPEDLASTQAAGVFSPTNPWMNAGFEVTTYAEGQDPFIPDGHLQARMVAPPTYLRIDEQFEQSQGRGIPDSTHEVVPGAGTSGNALVVHYDPVDRDKNLMLGQNLNAPGSPIGYRGATGIAFDVKSDVDLTNLVATLHYGDGQKKTTVLGALTASGTWQRLRADISVPADAVLEGAVIRIVGEVAGDIYFDNVVVEGSTFSVLNLKNDLTDGYAMVLLPELDLESGLAPLLDPVVTGLGERFLFEARVRDYTGVTPTWVDRAAMGGMVASIYGTQYATDGFTRDELETVGPAAFSATDPTRVLFAMPKDTALAQTDEGLAAMWAFVDVGGAGYPDTFGMAANSASGYFSAFKNGLNGYGIADSLDYAFTPVELGTTAATDVSSATSVAILTPVGGEFDVRIQPPATGWIEETTLTVTGFAPRQVTLDGSGADVLVRYTGDPAGRVAETTSTLFTRGDAFSLDLPVPVITVSSANPLSLTDVTFDGSGSVDVLGKGLDYAWDFDDGNGDVGDVVTHIFAKPGLYRVALTVTDADGKADTGYVNVQVLNRAPTATASAPATVDRLTPIAISGSGADLDGEVERVIISVDGVVRATQTGASAAVTLPAGTLGLGAHLVEVESIDDSGATSAAATKTINVVNLPPTAALAATPSVVRTGVPVTFTLTATDLDSPGGVTTLLDFGDGTPPLVDPSGTLQKAYGETGTYLATLTVTDSDGASVSASKTIVADGTPPVTSASLPPSMTGWYNGPVEVTLSVSDNRPGASAYYRVNDGVETLYSSPFSVSGEGTHLVRHHGVDAVGNVESPEHVFGVNIDETAPEMDYSGLPEDLEVVSGVVRIRGAGTDALSGMQNVRILIDGEVVAVGTDEIEYDFDTRADLLAMHDITIEGEDLAGNTASATVSVIVVNTPLDGGVPATPPGPTTMAGAARYTNADATKTCFATFTGRIDYSSGVVAHVEVLPTTTGTNVDPECQLLHASAEIPLSGDVAPCAVGTSASGTSASGTLGLLVKSCHTSGVRGYLDALLVLPDGGTVRADSILFAYARA